MRVPISFSDSWFITSHPTERARIRISQNCILRPNPRFGPQRYFQLPNTPECHQTSIPNGSPRGLCSCCAHRHLDRTLASLVSHSWSGTRSLIIFLFPQSFSLITFLVALWLISQFRILSALGWPPSLSLWSLLPSVQLSPVPWTSFKTLLGSRSPLLLENFQPLFIPARSWLSYRSCHWPTCLGLFCIWWCQSLPEVLFCIYLCLPRYCPPSEP